ncbi:hypothetical protein V8E52_006594 [Russula decolorans]
MARTPSMPYDSNLRPLSLLAVMSLCQADSSCLNFGTSPSSNGVDVEGPCRPSRQTRATRRSTFGTFVDSQVSESSDTSLVVGLAGLLAAAVPYAAFSNPNSLADPVIQTHTLPCSVGSRYCPYGPCLPPFAAIPTLDSLFPPEISKSPSPHNFGPQVPDRLNRVTKSDRWHLLPSQVPLFITCCRQRKACTLHTTCLQPCRLADPFQVLISRFST